MQTTSNDNRQAQVATIDSQKLVGVLSRKFRQTLENKKAPRPIFGNATYQSQVEFCYQVDEMARGPVYMIPRRFQETQAWIDRLNFDFRTGN